jgi:hypothetical protein
VKHRAPRRRTFRPRLAAVLVPTLVITGVAWSGALAANLGGHHKLIKHGAKEPAISAALDQSTYAPGEPMSLRVNDNLWAKHTWSVADSAGRTWTRQNVDKKGATFAATAGSHGGTVTITLTRTWDGARTGVSLTYNVVGQSEPTSTTTSTTTASTTSSTTTGPTTSTTTSTTTTPTTTTATTTTTTTTSSSSPTTTIAAPGAQWPGQIPGKFYLGMSCGTMCSSKETQLGQSYGVHRQYKNWGDWTGVAKDIQQDNAAGRLPWISIKGPSGGPTGWQAVADGSYDDQIKALATVLKANDDRPVLITFHHEPSNDGTEADGALWAGAYVRFHDVLKAAGALANVADPPILGDWLFNPANRTQDPANWVTDAVLQRAPFLGIDLYENSSGETFADRLPRILDWMADRGYPNKMIGIGESGSTDSSYPVSAVDWINESLDWVAQHTDKVGVVSYFNSTNNSRSGVYWPLDETAAKLAAYRGWLDRAVTVE